MATEEDNGAEFQEKTGLKRKLTGPPRLLLGKPKSPGQEEKSDAQALRKQRRDKNNETPPGAAEENQGNHEADCESQRAAYQDPQTVLTIEEETHSDVQDESLASVSKLEKRKVKRQHNKDRLGRSRAKATIRRVFSPAFTCVRRRKKLDVTSAEDAEDTSHPQAHISLQDILTNDKNTHERQPLSGDPFGTGERNESEALKKDSGKKGKRKFGDRLWPIFKRLSVTPNFHQRQERACEMKSRYDDTFMEIASENSVQFIKSPSAVETNDCHELDPSGNDREDEQLKGSSENDEEVAIINQEEHLENDLDQKEGCIEKLTLNAEVSVDSSPLLVHGEPKQTHCTQDVHDQQIPEPRDEDDTETQMNETSMPTSLLHIECIKECHSAAEESEGASDIVTTETLHDLYHSTPIEQVQCKPIITIEDVHSSDEENQESIEYGVPRCDLLSTVFSMNGSCHPFKVNKMKKCTLQTWDGSEHNSQFSEMLLVQTAFSLVNTAISAAVEQLSAELQNNQVDQDHV